jgi:hypothetical protein
LVEFKQSLVNRILPGIEESHLVKKESKERRKKRNERNGKAARKNPNKVLNLQFFKAAYYVFPK